MKTYIRLLNSENNGFSIEKKPIECPYCHQSQIPEMYGAIRYKNSNKYFTLCQCTNTTCQMSFNVIYDTYTDQFSMIKQSTQVAREFNATINDLSSMFCKIYNEAYFAEQMDLEQITGVGYRKAIEFLIKDYLISLDSRKADEIKSKQLGKCIDCYVTDEKIKQVAKRAAWLGNDETHYIRKWENKDVTHLKQLIDLCLHWIESEIETKKILEDMPEGR